MVDGIPELVNILFELAEAAVRASAIKTAELVDEITYIVSIECSDGSTGCLVTE